MYCPKCATQNSDDVRFCRGCGTAIEVVALALDGKLVPKDEAATIELQQATTKRLEDRHAKGMSSIVTGSVLMAVSLAILFIPMFFATSHSFPWVVIWSAFFGWMALWGTISVALGIGRVMESKRLMDERQQCISVQRGNTTSELPPPKSEQSALGAGTHADELSAPPSVTESTTRHLDAT